MTLIDALAYILLYITEFNSFAGLLHHSGWRYTYIVCRISSCTIGHWFRHSNFVFVTHLQCTYAVFYVNSLCQKKIKFNESRGELIFENQ